ncbi:MAG: hypothetical protein N3A58_00005 [Spirochaetes bacterium]|nr:hypothetical protein [Spirochaetota bacterium]
MKNKETIKRVKKFVLDNPEEKDEYELILNSENLTIIKEQFSYDKSGRAIITIWYEEEIN